MREHQKAPNGRLISDAEPRRRQSQTVEDRRRLTDRDVLYTRREAADYLRRSVRTLELWAQRGIGPEPVMVNGRALYTLRSLRAAVAGEAA